MGGCLRAVQGTRHVCIMSEAEPYGVAEFMRFQVGCVMPSSHLLVKQA